MVSFVIVVIVLVLNLNKWFI